MQTFPATVIIRHARENLKKCSLAGLESRSDCIFYKYPMEKLPFLTEYVVLSFEGPLLGERDRNLGLLILDGTWRYAAKMAAWVAKQGIHFNYRSLPQNLVTAYPRRQNDCSDPERGLASIEALYAAYHILGRPKEGLLDHYFWKESFLKKNAFLFGPAKPSEK